MENATENTPKESVRDFRKKVTEKISKFLNSLGKATIVVAAMITGFFGGNFYHRLNTQKVPMVRTHIETSVAINDQSEILLIDKINGEFQILSDTLGKTIFDIYASKMFYESRSK